jgi:histidyl-tRNA synthetase
MVSETAPLITDYLCLDCKKHFEDLKSYLCLLGIKFILNPRLMRGLDYYTRTAFEVTIPNLGAQKAIAGGGRYDNLVAELGGKATPAVGFAIGIERLLPYVPEETKRERPIFLVFLGEEALKLSLIWAKILREKRIWTEMDYRLGSLKSQLNRANSFKALWTLIIGGDEIKKGKAILRNMDNKEQTNISIHPKEGLSELLKLLGKRG